MKKSGVIGLVSLLFIIILGLFVWAAGGPAVDIISPANESLIGNNYPSPLLFTTQTSDTVVNDSYTHELWINGTSYGTKDCARETSCAKGPDGTIPEGVNLTWYVNATNGSNVNNTLTYTFSYDTINPFNNISGAYRGNATYFNAGSILAAFYINDTMLANYTLYLYNASNNALLHSYNRTLTTDANKTHNYSVQSWAETLNFSTTFYSGDAMDEDRYVYSLRSYDWFDNYNVSNVTIILDRTFPLLTYYGWAESNNTVTNDTHDIVFNVTFTETNFANATYTLLNTTSRLVLHSTNVTSSASTNVNFSGLPDGNYTFYMNVTDLATNQNITTRWKTVYLNATPTIDFGAATSVNNTYLSIDSLYVNISLVENNLVNITFRLINTSSGAVLNTTIYNATNYESYLMAVNYTSSSDGNYSVNVTATDTFNHRGNVVNRFFTIDTTYPLLTYYGWAESNNTVTNDTHDIVFNVTFTETNFANATYTLLNTTSRLVLHSSNVTSSASTNVNFSGLPDGNYTFYMNVTDLATNQNITTRWKTVFLNATPTISYGAATSVNNTNFTTNNLYVNISLVENNLVNITFRLINTSSGAVLNTTIYNATNYSSYLMAVNYTSLSDGNYSVNVTATDTFNHRGNVVNRFFTIDTANPVASASVSSSSIEQLQSVTLTCAGVDSIDSNPSVNLEVMIPGESYVSMASGYKSVSYTYVTTETYGTYYVRCISTDYLAHTHTAETSFFVDWATTDSSSSSSSSSGSSSSDTEEEEEEEDEEEVVVAEDEEVITESLETNVDWTETGVTELTGIVGGEVYTFVTAADEESHTINIDSVDEATGTVVVTIQSEPQTITLTLESPVAEVDLNGDLTADMRITLVGITDGEATISVEKIDGLFEEKSSTGLSAWVWVGIIVLVLGISVAIVYFVVKPQKK